MEKHVAQQLIMLGYLKSNSGCL